MTPCKKQPKPTNIKYYNSNSAVSLHFFTEKSQLSISVCIVVCRENNRIMNNVRINSVFCILTTVNLLLPLLVYVCVCVCVCVCVYIYTVYIYMYIYSIYIYICIQVCVYVCVYSSCSKILQITLLNY